MRGRYTAQGTISSLSAAKTLLYITAPSTACVKIVSTSVTNNTNETNEQIEIAWQSIGTLGTPTATTLTPSKSEPGDQAAASTVKLNVTASEPTYTANTLHGHKGVASLNGYFYPDISSDEIIIPPSGTFGLRLLSSPTAFDATVNVTFQEIG